MSPRKRAQPVSDGPSWRDVEPAALVFLTGKETYLAARALDRIRALVKESKGSVEFTRLEAASYGMGQLSVATSPSLFGDSKVIAVEDLAHMTDDFLTDALAYIQHPDPEVVVVFLHSGGTRGKKLLDALKTTATVVDCSPLKNDREKVDFVRHEFRVHGRSIDPDAARALTEAVGTSTAELAAACAQLLSDGPQQVSYEDVETYYGGRVEATAFKVADAALAGRLEIALKLWRQALATGTDPVPMVAALASKLRLVAAVHGVGESAYQLAGSVGAAPWQVEKAQQESRRFSKQGITTALKALADADAQVKGESRDAAYAVEKAITTVALSGKA